MENIVNVGGNVSASINYAMQQNYVPIIRNLTVSNVSDRDLDELEVTVTSEPEFTKKYTFSIGSLPVGKTFEIAPVRITILTEFLFSLTEKISGTLTISVTEKGSEIFTQDDPIELLAYDEWSGLYYMPEIIAAFAMPNHPDVQAVLRNASELLRKWTGDPSFTAYQTKNPNNVKLQMAAIYNALQKKAIVYNEPPPSYETVGQRIRLPHKVLENKQGTCLDLTVLYVSCLEAAGLFPIIIFIKGHAFAGCWLDEETFADCMTDDVSAMEKRTVQGAEQILLVECTDFTDGIAVDFDRAIKHGRAHLNDPSLFTAAVDIKRSRGSGIRPIPLRLNADAASSGSTDGSEHAISDAAPSEFSAPLSGKMSEDNGQPMTRMKIWERKLLDFSLRNTLLNFRPTKNSFRIMTSDLGELEDKLSDGKDFRILEIPSEWTVSVRDFRTFEIENEKDLIHSIAEQEFASGRIRTFLTEDELNISLKSLYRTARSSLEENGANTLFLALGFLRWFETDQSEKARYAPIVLIPVDIVRNVRDKGYIIRSRQEETQVNITLLEYLKQDHGLTIPGLDPLPSDEHGIDLPLVFSTVRQCIMGKPRWNIEEMAFVGLFSFSQFVMWSDLRSRSSEIESNKIVSSLINGSLSWQPKEFDVTVDNIDEKIGPSDMAIPLTADSSQLVAAAAAADGQSFVLHGPPGTGKSQTIANMIANALYKGKTVLFVAEKMAALNVVQKRLAAIGLDPFCLELHSNKTNKSAVLGQLNKALEVGRIKSPEDYERTAEKLHSQRKALDGIIEAMHSKRSFGLSVYEAIRICEKNSAFKGMVKFNPEILKSADKTSMDKMADIVRRFSTAAAAIGAYSENPLCGVGTAEYSIELRDRFAEETAHCKSSAACAKPVFDSLLSALGISDRTDIKMLRTASDLACILADKGAILTKLLASDNFDSSKAQLEKLISDGECYISLTDKINSAFDSSVANYNASLALSQWKQAEQSWFLPKMVTQNKLIKALRVYAKNPADITKENITDHYSLIIKAHKLKADINNTHPNISGLMGSMFTGISTDWNAVSKAAEKTVRVKAILSQHPQIKINGLGGDFSEYSKKAQEFFTEFDSICRRYSICFNDKDTLDTISEHMGRYSENSDKLRNIAAFNLADKEIYSAGLDCISICFKETNSAADLPAVFESNLYYALVLKTISEDTHLKSFNGCQYDDLIKQYKETIDNFRQMTVQELCARLSANVPAAGTAGAADSELGILKRAIKSNGRMMSVRKLFDQMPTLLRRLCPCMLMSPISVAQYIDPSFPKFDLVIFDEASQLPTSEAVGTIARAENAVIVGDPKQLPPTSFFSSNRIDEENADIEDLESLLDDCLAISMPQEYLKWHYRSRHESLIAFSNSKYYDNKLYTFPSPDDLVSRVTIVHPAGFYDKGKTKQNKAEAQAVVSEIIRRLSSEELRNESIGVVTFSSVQQNLIDDMLLEEFRKHPELEDADRKSKEPIFIKNLENVQGDERDVILFSVGYGPDAEGRVSMNFGPLNRDGGWRRLNVAVSRARKQMIVYSVLRPDQIDLSRTRSDGVAGLKSFLEFAERGSHALASRTSVSADQRDNIVNSIAGAITERGYKVSCGIGCSEFKVDIGIIDPENENRYLLGILLDSDSGSASYTACDRFVSQPGVLSGLGWKASRIWTMDWLDDPKRTIDEIIAAVKQAESERDITDAAETTPAEISLDFELDDTTATNSAAYISAPFRNMGNADAFYSPAIMPSIKAAAEEIIETESPISRKLLIKKVISRWGITRSGNKVEEIFNRSLAGITKTITTDEDRVFIWKAGQSPDEYNIYRRDDNSEMKRSADDIPSQEILCAAREVLAEQGGMTENALIRETAKKFGFTRTGSVIELTFGYAVRKAVQDGKLSAAENGNITLS